MDLRLLLLLSAVGTSLCYISKTTVQRLYGDLKKDYDPSLKPIDDQSSEVMVFVFLGSSMLLELDTTAQKMTTVSYFTIVWGDSFLTWNATEYDGMETLVFKFEDIWHPPLVVGISYDGQTSLEENSKTLLVYSNGTVIWSPGEALSVFCVMDITFYPFDTQECSIAISVPYTAWEVVDLYGLHVEPDKELLAGHPEWHFLDFMTTVSTEYDENIIIYKFLFRRRAAFIVYTTIVPLVLLSVLNACVVLVPVSSGEKGSIAVTLFLSYCVYTTTIGATLPPNSIHISLILLYMTMVQIFSGVTMLYSIFETSSYIHGNHKWLLCCLRCTSKSMNDSKKKNEIEESHDGQSEEPCNDQILSCFKILDHAFFTIVLILNVIVVITFAVLTLNSIRETLDQLKLP